MGMGEIMRLENKVALITGAAKGRRGELMGFGGACAADRVLPEKRYSHVVVVGARAPRRPTFRNTKQAARRSPPSRHNTILLRSGPRLLASVQTFTIVPSLTLTLALNKAGAFFGGHGVPY